MYVCMFVYTLKYYSCNLSNKTDQITIIPLFVICYRATGYLAIPLFGSAATWRYTGLTTLIYSD